MYSASESESYYAYVRQKPRKKMCKHAFSSYSEMEEFEVEKSKPKVTKRRQQQQQQQQQKQVKEEKI